MRSRRRPYLSAYNDPSRWTLTLSVYVPTQRPRYRGGGGAASFSAKRWSHSRPRRRAFGFVHAAVPAAGARRVLSTVRCGVRSRRLKLSGARCILCPAAQIRAALEGFPQAGKSGRHFGQSRAAPVDPPSASSCFRICWPRARSGSTPAAPPSILVRRAARPPDRNRAALVRPPIRIAGAYRNDGGDAFNQTLSEKRALRSDYLVGRPAASASTAMGYGSTPPSRPMIRDEARRRMPHRIHG